MNNNEHYAYDVIVVGAGPAGLSAALMLARSLRSVLVLDTGAPRNRFAAHMHGVPGHEGANPLDFFAHTRAEVEAYGVRFSSVQATTVAETASGVSVTTTDGTTLSARRLIAASGVRDDLPAIPGLAVGWGIDVLHCPYCHGREVRGGRLGVLATSPLGLHQAQLIRQWSPDLTFFSAGAGPVDDAVARALDALGVVTEPRPVTELVRDDAGTLNGVRVQGGDIIVLDAVFTAATLRPNDGYLASLALDRTESVLGSFIAADAAGTTSHSRLRVAGNIATPAGNVPISMASGSMAGSMANMDLVTEDFDLAVPGAHGAANAGPDAAADAGAPSEAWAS